jgi:AcrR family transcriptional regulator
MAVEDVIKEAGVSRRTFYDLFDSRADVFRVAYDEAFECFYAGVVAAAGAEEIWSAQISAALTVALELVARSPGVASMVAVDALGAGPEMARHHHHSIERFTYLLRRGRPQGDSNSSSPPCLERGLIGAVSGVVAARLHSDEAAALPALAPELAELIFNPYLGWRSETDGPCAG